MNSDSHKNYFETAYRTGTDIWSQIPYAQKGGLLLEKLSSGAMILDIGSGRGTFAFHLAKLGFKVIGLEYVKQIVEVANAEVKNLGLQGKVAFMHGNALEIPLADASFDAVTDFGLLHHLHNEDYEKYKNEVNRVLKPGGYYLNVSLSKQTKTFFEFSPKASADGEFEKEGLHYKFFSDEEIANIFESNFKIISQKVETIPDHNNWSYISTLLQKK